ncbi:E3 ubiquitin-protein ligase HACE1-like isoform X2 [Dreissena polymorpha]|nr:E3 ubiquitin-protein ligase HACE1-like isoform X2 [Dreissena polymorpha]
MLMSLVIADRHKTLSELISNSEFDINHKTDRGHNTLLHQAANMGAYECLCVLIKKGADVNAQDTSGNTALHRAAKNGHKKIIVKLLENKADINIQNNEGFTMVHWLAANGRHQVLEEIASLIGNLDIEDTQGQTALHVAAQNGHIPTVEFLLNNKADINKETSYGWTPLHFAISHGQHDTVKYLLVRGIRLLTRSKASPQNPRPTVHSRNSEARNHLHAKTPLELCVEGGYSETVDLLLKHCPVMYPQLIEIVTSSTISEIVVSRLLGHLCNKKGQPDMTEKLLRSIAAAVSHLGHTILSASYESKMEESHLLRCVTILSNLQTAIANSSFGLNEDGLRQALEPLSQLWQLLRDWMAILGVEYENQGDSCLIENLRLRSSTSSEPSPGIHDNNDGHTEATGKESPRPRAQTEVKRGPPLIEVMPPKVCSVIHAYYLVCSYTRASTVFAQFVRDHMAVIQALILRNPTLIFEHLHFVLDSPELLTSFLSVIHKQPFELRRKWFYEHISKRKDAESVAMETRHSGDPLIVDRGTLFHSSCSQLLGKNPEDLKHNLSLQFQGEEGMGQGVVREWFDVLSREILNPDYALFTQSADGCTFQPNSNSSVNPDHLSYFRFAGQCLGLALYHQQLISACFTRSFFKHILGIPLNYRDVASIDPEYAQNLQWILDHDITDLGLDLTFSVETDVFGVMEEVELTPGGSTLPVTEENKAEYVQLVTELQMTRAIQPQIDNFLAGFNQYVPQKLVRLFDEYELEVLLSGIQKIEVEDWKANTVYTDCDPATPVVQWFWEVVEEFSDRERFQLLQFATGSSRLPFGGFGNLRTDGQTQQFTISLVPYTPGLLPTASTCVNFLRLPNYPSKAETRDRLLVAIECGSQGYARA